MRGPIVGWPGAATTGPASVSRAQSPTTTCTELAWLPGHPAQCPASCRIVASTNHAGTSAEMVMRQAMNELGREQANLPSHRLRASASETVSTQAPPDLSIACPWLLNGSGAMSNSTGPRVGIPPPAPVTHPASEADRTAAASVVNVRAITAATRAIDGASVLFPPLSPRPTLRRPRRAPGRSCHLHGERRPGHRGRACGECHQP